MKRNLLLLILLALLSGFFAGIFYHLDTKASVKDRILFLHVDSKGDDYGPGTYLYPTHQHFTPHEGLLDLLSFKVLQVKDYYQFFVSFREITNPWQARYGFSHQLLQIYIDNGEGGSLSTLIPGAQVRFQEGNPWNYLIKASGWGVDLYQPLDDPDQISYDGDLQIQLLLEEKTILIQVPKDRLGSLEGASYYVLSGSFDVFGPDNFREVKEEVGTWNLGGGDDADYNPNVVDILTPSNSCQKEILGNWSEGQLAVLKPIGGKRDFYSFLPKAGLFLLFLLSFILLLRLKKSQQHW